MSTIIPSESISRKLKDLSKLKMLYNPDSKTPNISNAMKNSKMQALNPVTRKTFNFANCNKLYTPLGLTMSIPLIKFDPDIDTERDDGIDVVDHEESRPTHSHSRKDSREHCDECCCRKAETNLEKLQQEVNDLKELVMVMKLSSGHQINNVSVAPPFNTSFMAPPPPPPPLPPPTFNPVVSDPLKAIRDAKRSKKENILKPIKKEGIDMSAVLQEMKGVTLKQVPRSPGGTPYREMSSPARDQDDGAFLVKALQKRYESLMSPESSPVRNSASSFDLEPS